MSPKHSLPCSPELTTGLYPDPNESSPLTILDLVTLITSKHGREKMYMKNFGRKMGMEETNRETKMYMGG
jgi:hypothetical protein